MTNFITSSQNNKIKDLLLLQEKSKVRNKTKQFIVEGLREIDMALNSGYVLINLFVNSDNQTAQEWLAKKNVAHHFIINVNQAVYSKIAYRENTEGVVATFQQKSHELNQLKLKENALVLVAEGIEKPGNIGAMLRTADAAGIDAVIMADAKTDLYNPNIIRSSLGGVFTNQLAIGSSEEVKRYLKDNKFKIFSATLQNSNNYLSEQYTSSCALVVGSEAKGVSELWRGQDCQAINIPMNGQLDSMNVSVAAAILIYEAKRQKVC
jgi:TrmH family RNA methyltransferase